jgi:hypothetical protein
LIKIQSLVKAERERNKYRKEIDEEIGVQCTMLAVP